MKKLKLNDLLKKSICKQKGIKLIWMDWHGIDNSLMRKPRDHRIKIIKNLLGCFLKGKHSFLLWKNTEESILE